MFLPAHFALVNLSQGDPVYRTTCASEPALWGTNSNTTCVASHPFLPAETTCHLNSCSPCLACLCQSMWSIHYAGASPAIISNDRILAMMACDLCFAPAANGAITLLQARCHLELSKVVKCEIIGHPVMTALPSGTTLVPIIFC